MSKELTKYLLSRVAVEKLILDWEKQKTHIESLECFIARKQTQHILKTLADEDLSKVAILGELEKISSAVA